MNWNTEIPLWGVITMAGSFICAAIASHVRLKDRIKEVGTEVTHLKEEVVELKGEVAGFRARADQEAKMWTEIRERLVRIETLMERPGDRK